MQIPTAPRLFPNFSSSHSFLIIVAVFPVAFAALLTIIVKLFFPLSNIGADSNYATISIPVNNRSISRNYHVAGTIKQNLSPLHLFLVEENSEGIFPKSPIDNSPGNWSMELYTGAPAGSSFRIIIVAVNENDKNRFFKWFETGALTGVYSGITQIESLQMLNAVTVRMSDGQ